MVSLEKAKKVQEMVLSMPEFQYPAVNAVGITGASTKGDYAVSVNFVGPEPEGGLPDHIDYVEIVYRFNCGQITMQMDTTDVTSE